MQLFLQLGHPLCAARQITSVTQMLLLHLDTDSPNLLLKHISLNHSSSSNLPYPQSEPPTHITVPNV